MATIGDNSYMITGKVCPPKLPMENVNSDGWNSLTPSLLDSIFTETSTQGKQTNTLNLFSALSFQASVWLSTDGYSASSVIGLPYFFCNFCNYHTDGKAQLLRHMACQHVFKCKLCDFISITRCELVQHQLQKHLDAEEMQPILSSKMVHLNLSLLQRSLQNMSQSDNNLNLSSCSDSRLDKSELINSSEMNISKACPSVHQDVMSQELTCQSKGHPIIVKDDNPVTSSRCKVPNVAENGLANSGYFRKPASHIVLDSNQTSKFSKRFHTKIEHYDDEASPKRFRKGCEEHQTKYDNVFVTSQSHSCHMPHFLDESDSNVTSSCSPCKNTSPALIENSTEQITLKNSPERAAHDPNYTGRILSFLMEPISSSASVENTKSGAICDDNSASVPGNKKQIIHSYHDHRDANVCKEPHLSSPNVSQMMLEYSKDSQSLFTTSNKVGFCERERGHHLKSSSLSEERLQEQLENLTYDGSGDSFLESCQGLLKVTQNSNHTLLSRGSTSPKSFELSTRSSYDVSSENATVNRRQSEQQCVNSQNVENFLVNQEAITDVVRVTKTDDRIIAQNKNSTDGSKGRSLQAADTHSSADEELKYHLLRKLLIGASSITEHRTTPCTEFGGNSQATSFSQDCPPKSKESSEFRSQSSAARLTKASDMSLKDLLTQGLETIPSSVFYTCSYCSLKSSSKAELQRHVEKCKCKRGHKETKTNVSGHSSSVVLNPDQVKDEVSLVKTKVVTSMGMPVDGVYPSEQFVASEMLKSLSEHYSESLSSDISCQDKSHTPDRDFQNGELHNQVKGQIQSLDKTMHAFSDHEDVNRKQLRHRPERKKNPEDDYSYDSSNSSSSFNSDSDYTPHSVSNSRKKNKRKQNNKQDLVPNKRSVTDTATCSQQRNQDIFPDIYQMCLYCDFSTHGRRNMQQHLIGSHQDKMPFAEEFCDSKDKIILYFCQGAQSDCNFTSGEGSEIFEHIKVCYSGCLDNFADNDCVSLPDYSQVLHSLGEVSKCIDQSETMFYCLRCSYSRPDFYQVVDHISNNHDHNVAGILYVDKVFQEPRVEMVCLLCNSHVSVKQWALHACRMVDRNKFSVGDDEDSSAEVQPNLKLETYLRLSNTPNNHQTLGDEDIIDSYKLDSDSTTNCQHIKEECKPVIKMDHKSGDSVRNQVVNNNTRSHNSCELFYTDNFSETANVKQEIPDVYVIEDESLDDIPVHFSESGRAQMEDLRRTGNLQEKDNPTDGIDQQVRITNSPYTCFRKLSSGSNVLQSLLTAPTDSEPTSKSFSLLQNLLEPNRNVKEKEQPKSMSVLPAESTSKLAYTQSQYPCILEMLSRQGCTTQDTMFADSPPVPLRTDKMQSNINMDNSTNQISCVRLHSPSSFQISYQQHAAASSKCLPNISVSVDSKPLSVFELSPPLILHPPPLPMLPPLSPPPALLSPETSLSDTGSQNAPFPFANLLRLLSKSKFDPSSI